MNKLQASQYLYAKGPGAKVREDDGNIWTLKDNGNVVNQNNSEYYGLISGGDYSIIEPEKSNEELAKEAYDLWNQNNPLYDVAYTAFKFLLDVMDQKIKTMK